MHKLDIEIASNPPPYVVIQTVNHGAVAFLELGPVALSFWSVFTRMLERSTTRPYQQPSTLTSNSARVRTRLADISAIQGSSSNKPLQSDFQEPDRTGKRRDWEWIG